MEHNSASVNDAIQYANDVINGAIVACHWVNKACERFNRDLEGGVARGIFFDRDDAQHALDFYPLFTTHVKGALAGQQIELEPWQSFIIANLFGWKEAATGKRLFRTAYIEVARKNAKSTLSSGLGIYMLAFDGEGGAEVYSAATTRDQARIVYADAEVMVRKSPALNKRLGVHKNNIHHINSASKFEPLSSDANTLDGLNIHCGIVDELHAHKTRDVWDVLETATGAREQPLIIAITTAGSNKHGICYEQRTYLTKVLNGQVEDDTYFGIIYTLDEDDDWQDEANWIKANPNLGVSKKIDDMRRLAKKAAEMPTARNNFLTKHLNIWVQAETAWLDMDRWDRCPKSTIDISQLPCFIGLDLANKLDVAALVMLFCHSDGTKHLKCKFYLPEDQIHNKSKSIGNMYQSWAESGYLTLTPGNIIDHEYIESDLRDLLAEHDVQEVAFDPWGSTQLAVRLVEDGAPMVEVPQTVKNFSESMKEVEALVLSGKLHHNDNPVLNWMASNVVAKIDKNENIFPNKDHPDNKIDGMVALFTAMNRALCHSGETAAPQIRFL
ncbi:terminase large subunit [Litoribrevibacter albus]|uniref:Terminase n=1 Tax=Litoribrevibacter albus TaxID=1473156 RepID=A0AA37SAS0_9GAMM|nr:terminase TerL endonuclease subunit [Litoribrevibacter albus]GLQ31655.1 terminase [Litoribrevibacter albus]